GCIFWACCARSWLFTWRICISTELISTRSTITVPLTAWWQSHRHGFLTFFVENPDSFTDIAIVLPTLMGRRLAATMAGRSDIFVAKWRAASPAGLVGCRCAAADAGLRPCTPDVGILSPRPCFCAV